MRFQKIKAIFLGLTIFLINVALGGEKVQAVSVSAKAACLIILDSGEVLFAKNEHQELPMASTTKIMTALLTLEFLEACGNKEVEITDEMVRVEGTSMGLMPNDVVTLEALAKGMLLPSGNDAANAAAIAVGGTTENFVSLMNQKAKQIGMNNTKFVTPSGLDRLDHHSTAYDMAILGAFAMENDRFAKIVSKKRDQVPFVRPKKTAWLKNHNKLLRLYEGCIGIKTGFTKAAGRCLVSCANRNDVKLVAVTLDAPNDWNDHAAMFNYGFSQTTNKIFDDRDFKMAVPISNGDKENIQAVCTSSFSYAVKNEDVGKIKRIVKMESSYDAPIEAGQILGKVVYYSGDKEIGENNIVADSSAKKIEVYENFFSKIQNFVKGIWSRWFK